MDAEQLRAKQLFTSYQGNTIRMHRAGEYEEYKSYQVSEQTEAEWIQEMIDSYTKQCSIRDWEAVSHLESMARDFKDPRILNNVVRFASKHIMSADSVVKLMYVEHIINIVRSLKGVLSKELLYETLHTSKQILDDIISKPLIIDPGHELVLYNMKDKRSLNLRANNSMEALKSFLN
ncbi:hypothetical protein [Paenibacillus mendelii]|uniref:Uncharacterized protein n=1 Tax=Paenibacillus mendelii TaxID=206163 RepID=A0ABV6JKN6_9BACL|nr:hypothetical protein [Paenibacillus mendelii]MCQ6560680.1 hypothetical protein [Paenibacillus mendelii]